MLVAPEDAKIWESIDKDVREEVVQLIELCQDSSEMSESTHPKNKQYSSAIAVAVRILGE